MAYQSPWRLAGDFRRQKEIFARTDKIMRDPAVSQEIKDARARQFATNVSMRVASQQPDFANPASVGQAVIREALGTSGDDDVETLGSRENGVSEIEGVPSYGKDRINP